MNKGWSPILVFLLSTAWLSAQNPGGTMYFTDLDVFSNPGPGQGVVRYLDCGNDASLNLSTGLTMEAWIQLTIPTDNQKIMGKVDADGGASFNDGYMLGVDNSRISPEIWTPTNQTFQEGFIPPLSAWLHLAVTYEAGNVYRAYLNGQLVHEQLAGNNIVNDNSSFIIGIAPWDLNAFMTFGYLDEVRLWNVPRSEMEIKAGLFRNLTGLEAGLVLYQNFDNNTGDEILSDQSSAGNDCLKVELDETNFLASDCIIGDAETQAQADLAGLWFATNPLLQDPRITNTTNGLNLETAFAGADPKAYAVFGHNGGDGTSSDDLSATAPPNALRLGRVWRTTAFGAMQPRFIFDLDLAAAGGATLPLDKDANFYTLMMRDGSSGDFLPVAQAISKNGSIIQFDNLPIQSAYYTVAVGDTPFDISSLHDPALPPLAVKVGPTPTSEVLWIELEQTDAAPTRLQLFDSSGRLLHSSLHTSRSWAIDLPAPGMYLLQLEQAGRRFSQKVVVQ